MRRWYGIAVLILVIVLLFVLASLIGNVSAQPRQYPNLAKPFTLSTEGEFMVIRQEGFRQLHMRPASVYGMTFYVSSADFSGPHIEMFVGGTSFRFDVKDKTDAKRIADYVTGFKK